MSITKRLSIGQQTITQQQSLDFTGFSYLNVVDPNQNQIIIDPATNLLQINASTLNIEPAQIVATPPTGFPLVLLKNSDSIVPHESHNDYDVTWHPVSDIGPLVSIAYSQVTSTTTGFFTFGPSSSFTPIVRLINFGDISDASTNLTALQNLSALGTMGQVLTTDGSGNFSWSSPVALNALLTALNSQSKVHQSQIDSNTTGRQFWIASSGTNSYGAINFGDISDASLQLTFLQLNVGSNFQFLRSTGTTNVWHTLVVADLSDISTQLLYLQNNVGTSGQFLQSTGTTNVWHTLAFSDITGQATNSQILSITFSKISNPSFVLSMVQALNSDGSANQVLTTNGSGVLSWSSPTVLNTLLTALNSQSVVNQSQVQSNSTGKQFWIATSGTNSYGVILFADISNASTFLQASQALTTLGTNGQVLQNQSGVLGWYTVPGGFTPNALITALNSQTVVNQNQVASNVSGRQFWIATSGTNSFGSIVFNDISNSSTPLTQLQALAAMGSSGQYLTTNGTIFTWTTLPSIPTLNTLVSNLNTQTFVLETQINPPTSPTSDQIFEYNNTTSTVAWKACTAASIMIVNNSGTQQFQTGTNAMPFYSASSTVSVLNGGTTGGIVTFNVNGTPTKFSVSNCIPYENASNVVTAMTGTSAFVTFNSSSVPATLTPGNNTITITNATGIIGSLTGTSQSVVFNSSSLPIALATTKNIMYQTSAGILGGLTGTSTLVGFDASSNPIGSINDVTPYIATNSLPLTSIAQGTRCGMYVNNSYTSANVSLFPAANVTGDAIPYIKYVSGTNISWNTITGTSQIAYQNTGGSVSLLTWGANANNGIFVTRASAGDMINVVAQGTNSLTLANAYLVLGMNVTPQVVDGLAYFIVNEYWRVIGRTGTNNQPAYRQAGLGISTNYFGLDTTGLGNDATSQTKGAWMTNIVNGSGIYVIGSTAFDPLIVYTSDKTNIFNPSSSQTVTRQIYIDHTTYAWLTVSDKTRKTEVLKDAGIIDLVQAFSQMPQRMYSFKSDENATQYLGFYADDFVGVNHFQNVIKIDPESTTKFVNATMLTQMMYCTNVQQAKRIIALEAQVVSLNTQLAKVNLSLGKLAIMFPLLGL